MNNIQRVANKTSTLLKKLEKAQDNNTQKYREHQKISWRLFIHMIMKNKLEKN